MSTRHEERLLLAQMDKDSAFAYRRVISARLLLLRDDHDECLRLGEEVRDETRRAHAKALQELDEVDRICMRYNARGVDEYRRSIGEESDEESALMLRDIMHPVKRSIHPPDLERPAFE